MTISRATSLHFLMHGTSCIEFKQALHTTRMSDSQRRVMSNVREKILTVKYKR